MLKELIERKANVDTEDPVVAGRFVDLIYSRDTYILSYYSFAEVQF